MIHICFERLPCGALGMRLTGHAASVPAGETDLVCAAACMLAYTFESALKVYGEVNMRLESGFGRVLAQPLKGNREAALVAAKAVEAGCRALAAAYPECVEVAQWEKH